MNATLLTRIAMIPLDELVPFAGKTRSSIYGNAKTSPVPLWILRAMVAWYSTNRPIQPPSLDKVFREEFRKAWNQTVGVPSILSAADECSSDDDPPPAGGKPRGRKPKQKDADKCGLRAVTQAPNGESSSGLKTEISGSIEGEFPRPDSSTSASPLSANSQSFPSSQTESNDAIRERLHDRFADSDTLCKMLNDPATPPHVFQCFAQKLDAISMDKFDAELWIKTYRDFRLSGWNQTFSKVMRELLAAHKMPPCKIHPDPTKRSAVTQFFSRGAKTQKLDSKRVYAKDEENDKWWDEALDVVYGAISHEDKEKPHSKGPYMERAHMDDRQKLINAIKVKDAQIKAILRRDDVPALSTFEARIRDRYGRADKIAKIRNHHPITLGGRLHYAGECWEIDGTGYPAEVDGSEGTVDKNGKLSHNIFVRADVMSGQFKKYWMPGSSEIQGWSDALLTFLRTSGETPETCYAPSYIVCDRISELFNDLHKMEVGEPCKLNIGVIAMLAAEVQPWVHHPEVKTGKAHGEAAVKRFKSRLTGLSMGTQLFLAQTGNRKKHYRFFTVPEFIQHLDAVEDAINNSKLHRRSNTKSCNELFHGHAEAVAYRETRYLAPDWEMTLLNHILPGLRVVKHVAGRIQFRADNKHHEMRIHSAQLPEDAREGTALVLPCGMLAKHYDPNAVLIVLPTTILGQPRYKVCPAVIDGEDFYSKSTAQPYMFEAPPKALPETLRDVQAKRRAKAIKGARTTNALMGAQAQQMQDDFAATPEGAYEALQQAAG